MKVLKQLIGKQVHFGGEAHSGWLPLNSAIPQPTPQESSAVDVRILESDGGFIVEWKSKNTGHSNDSWHATLEDAERHANEKFGIESSEWQNPGGDI